VWCCQCSILICTSILLLPEGQGVEAWELPNKGTVFCKSSPPPLIVKKASCVLERVRPGLLLLWPLLIHTYGIYRYIREHWLVFLWCDAVQFGRNLPSFRESCWIHLIIDREEVNRPLRNVDKFIPVYTVSHPRRRVECVVARDAELSPCILKCVDGGTGVNTINMTCVFCQ
jgi:hypothetical protein